MTARKPLPVDLIDALLADCFKKPQSWHALPLPD